MADDNDTQRRWVPWSRETDTKAKLYSAIAGLFLAVVTSGTGVLRVGKFTLSDHARSVKTEMLITEAQISAAIRGRELVCNATKEGIDKRFEAIERVDTVMHESIKTCKQLAAQINEKVDYFQRKYWERGNE